MLSKNAGCRGCPLEHDGRGFSIPEGTGALRVLVVAESLGDHEVIDGLPLRPHAPAGSVFERGLRKCGLSRAQLAVANCCFCQPPHNDIRGYEGAIQHCQQAHLRAVIERFRPTVILALGNIALSSLTGFAGTKQGVENVRGYVLPCLEWPDIHVIPTYHPSYIVRGAWNVFGAFCRDIKFAVQVAKQGWHPAPVEYIENAGAYEFEYIKEQCSQDEQLVISADFETEGNVGVFEDQQLETALLELYGEKRAGKKLGKRHKLGTDQRITSLNISIHERQSFVFEWTIDKEDWCKEILALNNPKVGHNFFSFDLEVARFNKVIVNGIVDDTMLCFHCLYPDLPGRRGKIGESETDGSFANLQYCASFAQFDQPWKHLVKDQPGFYGCCDSDATLRLFNMLKVQMAQLRYGTSGPSIWDSYIKLVANLWPCLRDASRRGIPVDQAKILAFLDSVVKRQQVIGEQIQSVIPVDLIPVKNKTGYKKTPRDTAGMVLRDFEIESETLRCKCNKVRKTNVEYWTSFDAAEYSTKDGRLRAPDPSCELCKGYGWICLPDRVETRWCKLDRFNPNSPVQMKAYAAFHHHKIPLNKEHKHAMDKWTLDQMAKRTRDPLYRSAIEYRQFEKMASYAVQWSPREVDIERGWEYPAAHPEFSFFPATGQLSSFNPNCFSSDTEVLTEQGWMTWEDYAPNQCRVAEFDTATGHIRFSQPNAFINRVYKGAMLHIYTEQQIDMLVTPDHDCLLRDRKRFIWRKFDANAYPSDWLQYNAGLFVGGNVALSPTQMILICALQADGTITKSGAYAFQFTKKRKIQRLHDALHASGIPFTLHNFSSSDKQGFYVSRKDIPEWWAGKKFFGAWLLDLDMACFGFMAEEVYFWDGYFKGKTMYSSSHKINADWVQILTALSNRRARIREYWNGNPNSCINFQVDATNKPYSLTTNMTNEMVDYDGRVYCVSMPWGTVVTRRNNVVSITGNCQNLPSLSKYGPLAHEFRDAIEAPPGYVIAELDLKSFHAQTLGFEAGCPDYIRLAKLDVHSFVAGNMLKLPYFDQCIEWDDKELLDFLKWHRKNYVCPDGTTFQKVRDERAKVGVLAFGLGQSPNTLFEANRDSFLPDWFIQCDQRGMVTDKETRRADREGVKAAQLVHDTLNDRFPELKAYRENTPLLARQRDYLISRYGCIRWFWDILHWDARRREMVHGDDFDKAIAFPVQNDGHGYLKYALLRMEAAGMLERYGFINCIHDSVVFHCSERLLDEACVNVKAELERPSDVLTFPDGTGLSVQCEIKAGKTWGVMEEIAI